MRGSELIETAMANAVRGEHDALIAAASQVDDASGEGWRCAASSIASLAGMAIEAPSVDRVRALATSREARRACAHAARWIALGACLSLDRGLLERVAALQAEIAGAHDEERWARLSSACLGIARGDAIDVVRDLTALEHEAARSEDAAAVVDAASLRALAHASGGHVEEALDHARRASRMARTEGLPQSEYLANVALARVRRLAGRPHLASRILSALARFAPAPWHRWIGWELAMAAGADAGEIAGRHPPATHLVRFLEASSRGDRESVRRETDELSRWSWSPIDHDVAVARAALGDLDVERVPPSLADWRAGQIHDTPLGLGGLVAGVEGDASWVLAEPGGSARRILAPGCALVDASVARLAPSSRTFARTDAILSALAFAGPEGADVAATFRDVWGFKYAPSVHQGVLDTALHRARQRVAPHGAVERRGDRLELRLIAPVLVPDPRCGAPAAERVLSWVARRGRTTAQEAADALGIPLRSAQASLKLLVDDGACNVSREGRRVDYQVEDTTFQVPTQHGRKPA